MIMKRVFVTQKSNNVSFAIVRYVVFSGVSQCSSEVSGAEGVGASCGSSALVGYFCVVDFRK